MGWDINTVTEFKNKSGEYQIAQDYVSEHTVDGYVTYNVIDPVAEFRNYNLFRVLAGVHNTQKFIDQEKCCWEDYERSNMIHNSITNYYKDKYRGEYWPESDHPITPVKHTTGMPSDANIITKKILEFEHDEDIHCLNLEDAKKYVKQNPDAQQFRLLVDKLKELYTKCKTINPDLQEKDFRLVYGFNY